ncbi:hypothetical protein [Paraflavitalea pollutisoli]|uniref:hypothetical protein n=1 Tax=Paraflavitalea pollutisoli TaxID=3034143 RepID=UPI0023EDEF93|nr:hypothetical protein [Paraflavitalea sp. H1-2-19X]
MAKQIAGLCFLEGTIDDLTFYKMDGQYYCRTKSCLTSERVKTSPRFRLTMMSARRMARASRIGAAIYKALPPRWRQFWMYRSFTGEAFTLLKHTSLTEEAITAQLSVCYVAYWEQRRAADPDNIIWQPVPVRVRKRRQYSAETIQRRLKASRSRAEIREDNKRAEEERRQTWVEQLAARAAAKAAVIALQEAERGARAATWLTIERPAVVDKPAKGRKRAWPTRRRTLARGRLTVPVYGDWAINQHGIQQQQQRVPAVTRKRRTGTRTILGGRQPAVAVCQPCDSS